MKTFKQWCFFLFLSCNGLGAFAQVNFKISHQQALADLDSFVVAMKEIHPDLFFKCDEEVFNKFFMDVQKK